jgi:SAM-dependent methyltransferase
MNLKSAFKRLIPKPLRESYGRSRARRAMADYAGKTTEQVFTHIYKTGAWGKANDPDRPYFSGRGSHQDSVVAAYVDAVRSFITTLPAKPDVLDLGCGDFAVGSKLRDMCARYTACDIVADVIAFNRQAFAQRDVDFRVLDITRESPPQADIVFIRQVLQHLSNSQVADALARITGRYKYLVLTEHLPKNRDFTPNLDKPAGPDIRLRMGSGLDLRKPPFDLQVVREQTLCEVTEDNGIIQTKLYELT